MDQLLARIQASSGLVFGCFSTIHLGGHALSVYSFDRADAFMLGARELYQAPYAETVVFGSLLVHIIASSARYYIRSQAPKKQATRHNSKLLRSVVQEKRYHRYSGYFLGAVILVHVTATRLGPLLVLPDPSVVDLTMVTHSFQDPGLIMIPYYIALGTAGMYHSAYGSIQALREFGLQIPVKAGLWTRFLVASTILMTATTLALYGAFEIIYVSHTDAFVTVNKAMMRGFM